MDEMPDGFRAARDERGYTTHVEGMNYADWKAIYVDRTKTLEEWREERVQKVAAGDSLTDSGTMKAKAEPLRIENFPEAFSSRSEKKNTQAMIDYINALEGADPDVIAMYNSMGKLESVAKNGIEFKIPHTGGYAVKTASNWFTNKLTEVTLTIPKLKGDNLTGQIATMLHEEMHLIDLYCRADLAEAGWFSASRKTLVDAFQKAAEGAGNVANGRVSLDAVIGKKAAALIEEFKTKQDEIIKRVTSAAAKEISTVNRMYREGEIKVRKDYESQLRKIRKSAEAQLEYESRNLMGGGMDKFQDICDALSGGQFFDLHMVRAGHGSKYYQRPENLVLETTANYAALSVLRPDLVELLREEKPELVAELAATVKEILKKAGEEQ